MVVGFYTLPPYFFTLPNVLNIVILLREWSGLLTFAKERTERTFYL